MKRITREVAIAFVDIDDCGCEYEQIRPRYASQRFCRWHRHNDDLQIAFAVIARVFEAREALLASGWKEPQSCPECGSSAVCRITCGAQTYPYNRTGG